MAIRTRRREFMTLLGSAAAWPLAARAQPTTERVRRIGVLLPFTPGDAEANARKAVFEQRLQQLGWTIDRDLQIDVRLAGGNPDRLRQFATEIVALKSDVIVTVDSVTVAPAQQATCTIPIMLPIQSVQSLARPGGNATGFTNFEYSMSGKWAELVKQISPRLTRAAVLRDQTSAAGIGQFAAIQSVAQSLGIELTPIGVRDSSEVDQLQCRLRSAISHTTMSSMWARSVLLRSFPAKG